MFEELIKQIKNNEIDTVDLSRETLRKSFYITNIKDVLHALEKNTSVKKLNLKEMWLSDKDILYNAGIFSPFKTSPLISLVKKNKTIIELDINSTEVTEVGLNKLKDNASKQLIISHSYKRVPSIEELAKDIAKDVSKQRKEIIALQADLLKYQKEKIETLTKKLAVYESKESQHDLGFFTQQKVDETKSPQPLENSLRI